ncbi:trehalose 6-phosphate synthase [Prosthecochloris sp. N3]|uniref:Trehalose 6-phosphate synthase n=1 Tax=Prosthecochloris ethylica TaxID=2743976 RepID=A0ABR9XQI9_9CHLB|nr:trehalose 6-phosphate synthase [Prosthecochloris ethylica]MBF0585458.1 trehalose 6-phosphate synthase [Prosthecochloris ethylica]MBF0636244.1 trehalose 6-phosphate synthase [Prosthecochloris ethylica]NUK46688.1 trehalose 6-phosphate synthase [Prosthecochloris ethylica]
MDSQILQTKKLTTCAKNISLQDISTLKELYKLKSETRDLREPVVRNIMKQRVIGHECIESLKNALYSLETVHIDDDTGQRLLSIDGRKQIEVDLTYEIRELKKDIYYLEYGEDRFIDYLTKFIPNFRKYVNDGIDMLSGMHFNAFVTDRDGTTNNYCGRYRSSIQPIYNSVFLSRFAKNRCNIPIFITSAPLKDFGILNVSINPSKTFVYAGSKGREFIDLKGEFNSFPINEQKQKVIRMLNERLLQLLQDPNFEKFNFIGSALQLKFGQTTVARQDISHSIKAEESTAFLEKVKSIVREIDPENKNFRIEDTGLDVEIILTIDGNGQAALKDFDKGDGLDYISRTLEIDTQKGPNLVCGDTASDIPMLEKAMETFNEVYTIFVTKDDKLAQRVRDICQNSYIVPSPDILLTILGLLSL